MASSVFISPWGASYSGGSYTFNGPLLAPDGSAAAPSYAFANEPTFGWYRSGASQLAFTSGSYAPGPAALFSSSGLQLGGAYNLQWSSTTAATGTADVSLSRDAANTLAQRNGVNAQAFRLYNTFTDAANYERAGSHWIGSDYYVVTQAAGTGTGRNIFVGTDNAGALFLRTGGTSRYQLTSLGHFIGITATGGIGYGTGAGGTVTQATNKATGVTLNTVTGEITMNAAALAAAAAVTFVLTDSAIAAGDYVMAQHVSAGTLGAYVTQAVAAAGSANITVTNRSGGSLSEAIVLKFVIFKAVTA